MNNLRFRALETTMSRRLKNITFPEKKASEYFGELTFNKAAMKEYLSEETFKKVMNSIDLGEKIDRKIADQVATGMKAWALHMGATHYTHWFLPLTGSTAEKHDTFVSPTEGGKAIENFRGSELTQQEPDASSFPSGGIRSTFEARGYTAWDPTSPAFIMDKTLCIPTIFISYTGEALDFKTPLLKALYAVDQAAVSVCRYFNKDVTKVIATLGWEQEYFLIDTALYLARPDLVLTDRTLFGHASAKDQQLEDHYFGAIPPRVIEFMEDFEMEAHRIGIPVKTRHNEVAPNQFECAPVFEEANLSVDHNQLIMHLMDRVARRHDFKVLLHEKPYHGVNGSGKHNNWSLMTNTQENLLSPGHDPISNLRFLTFLITIIKAVHEHADLLRAAIASSGNDYRLGANEAPPAIISIFIGEQLTRILNALEKSDKNIPGSKKTKSENLNNLPKVPDIHFDNTDRNRTSPFAFTGNKFEFRAVGSSQSCAPAMITLNLILADQLKKFKKETDSLIKSGISQDDAILKVLRKYLKESGNILFEGNNYGEEWIREAKRRGLSNVTTTPHALKAFLTKKSLDLFKNNNVLSNREMESRHEIRLENYIKKIQIESRVLGEMATNYVIPAALKYLNVLVKNLEGINQFLPKNDAARVIKPQAALVMEISGHITTIKDSVDKMVESRKVANRIHETEEKALLYCEKVKPFFDQIRYHADKLELLVDDELWPLPKYREMLFIH